MILDTRKRPTGYFDCDGNHIFCGMFVCEIDDEGFFIQNLFYQVGWHVTENECMLENESGVTIPLRMYDPDSIKILP